MQLNKQLGFAGIALAGCLASTAHAVVIDDFSAVGVTADGGSPWPVVQYRLGSMDTEESSLVGVLGGVRRTRTTLSSVSVLGVDFMTTAIVPQAGLILDYAASTGADGRIDLTYDGAGSLNVDFSNEASIDMQFADFDFAFSAILPVTITLSDGTNSASLTHSLTHAGAASLSFAINQFTGVQAVDLTSISSIVVGLDAGVAADYRLTAITTVPIPAPGSLALLTLAGGAALRRRRR